MARAQDAPHPGETDATPPSEPNPSVLRGLRTDSGEPVPVDPLPLDPPEIALVLTEDGWRRFLPDYRDDWTHDPEGFPILSGWLVRNTTDLPAASPLGPMVRLAGVRHGNGLGRWRPISDAYYALAGCKPMDPETLEHLRLMMLPPAGESEPESPAS